MRLLIAQLSDIHLRSDTDRIFQQVDQLAAAIASADYEADACLLMYCGDIAFSGTDSEYMLALEFIIALRAKLTTLLPPGCSYHEAFIPGNHDCSFSGSQEARTYLIDGLLAKCPVSVDEDLIRVCTAVQDEFFSLLDAIGINVSPTNRLVSTSSIVVADKTVVVNCVNSAWLSREKETQGQLLIPVGMLPSRPAGDTFVITAIHHPYNWLASANARQ